MPPSSLRIAESVAAQGAYKREKAASLVLKTLELEKGDTFVMLSNITKQGKDKILKEIEDLVEEDL